MVMSGPGVMWLAVVDRIGPLPPRDEEDRSTL